ncbi:MAG: hypothetical protein EOP42_32170 [Sphingobacteriaceae bacterium]|nr:MAG: hypothetical protein EOP42_32170 [Sphingobacteriaceae bacterium]
MKKQLAIILLLLVVIFSCKKDNNGANKGVSATVFYTGEIALDGCGWLIGNENKVFLGHPVNLPDAYKKDNLPIVINYHLLNSKYQCSTNASFVLTDIYIDAIRKQ